MQRLVDGESVDLTNQEVIAANAAAAACLAAENNRSIRQQILILEAKQTPRRVAEAILDQESPVGFLADLRQQIATLRSQLT